MEKELKAELDKLMLEIFQKDSEKQVSFVDKNNIVWKMIDGKKVGKRAIQTKDLKTCWLEDTTVDNVKLYLHGEDADYNESL